ncbi:MAG: hypothetical protein M3277_09270 [Actinomycetota bacterium]|nr:hypothetical protein [Actinomycetota bacterium]
MHVEEITAHEVVLGYLIRGATEDPPDVTTFVTRPDASLQVGFIVKDPDHPVPRHRHKPVERALVGTAEVLYVARGSGQVALYDASGELVAEKRFAKGDLIVLLDGGHRLDFDTDTTLVEVKQGPYPGTDEKELY